MKLIDVKRPKRKHDKAMEVPEAEGERYPWGLRLTFEKEEIAKIKGLKGIAVGAKVNVQGIGKVTSVRITTTDNENERTQHTVEIQIQRVGVANTGDADAAWKLSATEFEKQKVNAKKT